MRTWPIGRLTCDDAPAAPWRPWRRGCVGAGSARRRERCRVGPADGALRRRRQVDESVWPGQFAAHGAHSHQPSTGPQTVLESVKRPMFRGHALTGWVADPSRHETAADVVAPANPAGESIARSSASRPTRDATRKARAAARQPAARDRAGVRDHARRARWRPDRTSGTRNGPSPCCSR
ncbi:hypothetical protein ACFPM0_34260 [Pseudonocardia sulfidoxydans]|uniref:hypothetical protein n=1 Tax=Pseudonocardia sulfidoxydans TaxID=54011 RepID=UPI0036118D4D